MKIIRKTLLCMLAASCIACGPGVRPDPRRVPSGQALFQVNASGHGADAAGNGPAERVAYLRGVQRSP